MITVTKDLEGRAVSTNGALADFMDWISRENHFKLSSILCFYINNLFNIQFDTTANSFLSFAADDSFL